MAIIQAVGFTLGMGSGTIVSLHLGAKEDDKATCAASTGFFTAIVMGLLLTLFGSIFVVPLMRLLGATETILPYARDYGQYILLAAPIMCASFVMNNIFRCEGKSVLGMLGIGTGGILNIILDPIFIFGLGLGTAGAAIATALSQTVSFIILLILFLKGKSDVRLRITKVSKKLKTYVDIITTGMPTLCRQGLASLASVALNVNAAIYGDAAVAAMSIVGRLMFFMFSAMLGFGQGFQPVAGFNYGAKKLDRVSRTFRLLLTSCMTYSTVLWAVAMFAPMVYIRIFTQDAALTAFSEWSIRIYMAASLLFGAQLACQQTFIAIGDSKTSLFLALLRKVILLIPLIYVLPNLFENKVFAVFVAEPIADTIAVCTTVTLFLLSFRKMKRELGANA